MKVFSALVVWLLWSSAAVAQATTAYTITVFNGNVTTPETGTPVAPAVTYPIAQVPCGITPKLIETFPIVTPIEGRIDDPVDSTRDCSLAIQPQMAALAPGVVYRAAVRAVSDAGLSPWSELSSPFTVGAVQVHPCDGPPPTTGTAPEGTRTLLWCWDGLDTNGNATTVTTWTATVDGVRVPLTNVTVSPTPNAQGKRLHSASIALVTGTRSIRVAGTNAIGEAAFSAVFTGTVTPVIVLSVPTAAEIRGIQ